MKTAPVIAALERRGDTFAHVLVHTGQHYDREMSQIFFEQLQVGEPDYMLGVGSGSHAQQLSRTMERLEPVLLEVAPDIVLVPGDVNSTLAAALVAAQLGIPIGHIESGLRSFDLTMPEEVNRKLTDALSDLLFTHSPEARTNLLREGCDEERILDVGNTMIDTLVAMRDLFERIEAPSKHGVEPGDYLLVTLHRPALVDGPLLADAYASLEAVAEVLPVVFPAHPRTRAALDVLGLGGSERLRILEPLGYFEFLSLLEGAAAILTDSGGVQEESTFLGVPCFTLRDNTERPITVERGTNVLLGLDPGRIAGIPEALAGGGARRPEALPGWDGHAAERIADELTAFATDGPARKTGDPGHVPFATNVPRQVIDPEST